MAETIVIGKRRISISNRDKPLFPDDGLTKGDLIDYYLRIAPTMLPFLRGRPLTMHLFPDGIGKEGYFRQEIPDTAPGWIHRARLGRKQGGEIVHAICDNAATLCYLAGQACITPHVWLSRADRVTEPDQMIFDLDPADGNFAAAAKIALYLRDILEKAALRSFVKTTGSHGLHVLVPLRRKAGFEEIREFARAAAERAVRQFPDEATTEIRINKRAGRVYIDVLRNAYGQTAVAPYAVRALPGAPIAAPIDWSELSEPGFNPRKYTMRNIFQKLEEKGDPWAGLNKRRYLIRVRGKGV